MNGSGQSGGGGGSQHDYTEAYHIRSAPCMGIIIISWYFAQARCSTNSLDFFVCTVPLGLSIFQRSDSSKLGAMIQVPR